MKVLVHAHTAFSGDGELSPQQLADLARSNGFDAVLLADHFESLTAAAFAQLVEECRNVTNCLMAPGYERSIRGYHVLALGTEQWFVERNVERWAGRIAAAGGMTVVAHPSRYRHEIPNDILNACEAVEVWNSKFGYDGSLAPNPRAYDLLGPHRLPLCSQDLHGVRHLSGVGIEIPGQCKTGAEILAHLRRGDYRMTNGVLSFDRNLSRLGAAVMAGYHQARRAFVERAIRARKWARKNCELRTAGREKP